MPNFTHTNRVNSQKLLAKIWQDSALKTKFLTQPKHVLAEYDIPVAPSVEIRAHENTPALFHLVLPEKPDDDSIKNVSAGGVFDSTSHITNNRFCLCF